jgi:hypothetical protein
MEEVPVRQMFVGGKWSPPAKSGRLPVRAPLFRQTVLARTALLTAPVPWKGEQGTLGAAAPAALPSCLSIARLLPGPA